MTAIFEPPDRQVIDWLMRRKVANRYLDHLNDIFELVRAHGRRSGYPDGVGKGESIQEYLLRVEQQIADFDPDPSANRGDRDYNLARDLVERNKITVSLMVNAYTASAPVDDVDDLADQIVTTYRHVRDSVKKHLRDEIANRKLIKLYP